MDVYTPNFDDTLLYLQAQKALVDNTEEQINHWDNLIQMIEDPALNPYGEFHQLSADGTNVHSDIFVVMLITPDYKYPEPFMDANELLFHMQSEDEEQTLDIFFHRATMTREEAIRQVEPVLNKLHGQGAFVEED